MIGFVGGLSPVDCEMLNKAEVSISHGVKSFLKVGGAVESMVEAAGAHDEAGKFTVGHLMSVEKRDIQKVFVNLVFVWNCMIIDYMAGFWLEERVDGEPPIDKLALRHSGCRSRSWIVAEDSDSESANIAFGIRDWTAVRLSANVGNVSNSTLAYVERALRHAKIKSPPVRSNESWSIWRRWRSLQDLCGIFGVWRCAVDENGVCRVEKDKRGY